MNRETFSKKIKASVMPVQPGITQVDHGDVPVTVRLARLCHSYMPVEPRWNPSLNPVSHQCYKTLINEGYKLQLNI